VLLVADAHLNLAWSLPRLLGGVLAFALRQLIRRHVPTFMRW